MTPKPRSSNNASATLKQGEDLFCDEKYMEALAVFRGILEADPTNSAALNDAGITFGALGDVEKSFDFLHAALQADPTCAPAFFNLIDLAITCEAVEAGRKIYMLFQHNIEVTTEKKAFEDMLFSPEAEALIAERRQQVAAAANAEEEARLKNLHVINQQTQQIARSAA